MTYKGYMPRFIVLLALTLAPTILRAQERRPVKVRPAAVEVKMIPSDELMLPAAFQVSLYENLIDQLQKKRVFQTVYRDGDRNAETVAELTTLECTVLKLKKGSEMLREVTTVAGATSMTLRCELRDSNGDALWVRDISGKVRFFGASLKATYDFAKKAAAQIDRDLQSANS